jgi:hypothetical protein
MASESYSFSPQFATIRSESPLAGMRPVASIQHTALSFKEDKPFQIRSSGEELVGLGAIEGVNKGVGAALQGITTAYVSEREKKQKDIDETNKFERDKELARIRAKGDDTDEEKAFEKKYKEAQLKNLESQIETRKEKEDKKPVIRPRGFFAPSTSVKSSTPVSNEDIGDAILLPEKEPPVDNNIDLIAPVPEVPVSKPTPGISLQGIPAPAAQTANQKRLLNLNFYKPSGDTEQVAVEEQKQQPLAFEVYQPKVDELSLAGAEPPAEEIQYEPNDLISAYESWEDAEMANQMLAKKLPDYEVKPVKQETVDGQSYFIVEPPVRKQTAQQIPSNLAVKSAKKQVGDVTYDLVPKGEVKQQVKALKEPLSEIDTMLRTIRQIRSIYQGLSPGVGGLANWLSYIPGSDAADVEKLTKTLQGNIAFKKLADMKAASPTGGALGAISERELDLLASNLGSIDPGLSFFLFKENIDSIEDIVSRSKQGIENEIQLVENPQKFQSIQSSKYKENATATNPKTGEKIVFKNGQWIPAK